MLTSTFPVPGHAVQGTRAVPAAGGRGPGTAARPREHRTCPSCVRELFDPAGRRHGYALVSCSACGPAPRPGLDAPRVRLADLCADCVEECRRTGGRRTVADSTGCAACGPRPRYGCLSGEDALSAAVAAVQAGSVVAVRDMFADQIVCDARAEYALARMDGTPARPRVLVRNVSAARRIASVSPADIAALVERAEPSVLLRVRDHEVSRKLWRGTPDVEVFLPRTPLHHLVTARLDAPLAVWDRRDQAGSWPYDGVLGVGGGLDDMEQALPAAPGEGLPEWWLPAAGA
ncbi:Sua5/YciO/YrdC/YwlC family protein [Microbispora sp. ATCC PTA-5024]|uniref:Sua5/YciO/YrdC/YwlC family protein n=1 Tax=Microbispora sp. ATCC PTA-5024 TaxID=316330 RepID=UPI0009FF8D64|nr:Sua5/YciO/YrdC/YwlC family protein [Microbispora sp. ATCC PTA-5024]